MKSPMKSRTLLIHNQLVHATGSQRGANRVHNRSTGANIGQQLPLALRRVGAFLEQNDGNILPK